MHIDLEDLKECMAALCLFRSCIFLEMLKICHRPSESAGVDTIKDFWEAECLDCQFNHLVSMEMADILGLDPEMAFMEFVLAHAPKLLLLNVRLDKKASEDSAKFKMVTKGLLSFPRASKRARIILKD